MGIRRHAWLQLQEVDVGTSVERHGGDLGVLDDDAVLCTLRLHSQRIALYADSIGDRPELHRNVDAEGRISIDLYPELLVVPEALLAGVDVVRVNIEGGKSIKAFSGGDRPALHIGRDAGSDDGDAWDHRSARVSDHSGDR